MTLFQKIKAVLDEANKDLAKEQHMVANGIDYHAQLRNVMGHRAYILEKLKKVLENETYK
jgi:RNase P/RNase MRP subunit p30